MPVLTGTALTPNDFMEDLITFAQSNGWILNRGSISLSDNGDFPLVTRYVKIKVSNSLFNDTALPGSEKLTMAGIAFRETAGGPDLAMSVANLSVSGGSGSANLLDGSSLTAWDAEPDTEAEITYDFGSVVTIREMVLTPNNDADEMPRDATIFRSDDGINFGEVYSIPTVVSWTAQTSQAFTFPPDGDPQASSTANGGVRRPVEFWLEGLGYDVDRRVHLGFRTYYDLAANNGGIEFNAATVFDPDTEFEDMQDGAPSYPRASMFVGGETINYWVYLNNTRMIFVFQSSGADYASCYLGFMAAFGNPDQYPFPLYLGANTNPTDDLDWDEINTANSCFFDPGENSAYVFSPTGVWSDVSNQADAANADLSPVANPNAFVYPWHLGNASAQSMPFSPSGNTLGTSARHWLTQLKPTLQDDLPIYDAIVYSATEGAYGALQGVVGIPGAGTLVAETTFTISADTYRIFPNRTKTEGNNWIAIQEV